MKTFEITPDIQEFQINGQKFSETYTVYRLKDISEKHREYWTKRGYTDKNDIISIVRHK